VIRAAVAACLLVLFAADAYAGHEAMSAQSAKATTYHDGVGENSRAPDITTVTVSSEASRALTFDVDVPTHPILTEDMRIRVWLDVDDDPTTGLTANELLGVDHFFLVDRWELGLGAVGLFRCSGSTCGGGVDLARSAGLRFSYESGATFLIDAVVLGIPRLERIRFSVETMAGVVFDPVARRYDFTNVHQDFAPENRQLWTYESRPLLVQRFSATPTRPSAGKPYALRLDVVRTDTGAVLASGTVSCSLRISGKAFRARIGGFVRKQAVCVFDIPRNAAGKRFRSSISVLFDGARITRSLSGAIR
jgi:hypothetical protein